MSALGVAKNVSPLIRFCRWGGLVLGVTYGTYRYNSLARKEVKIQEYENKIRAKRAERLAVEKADRSKAEMDLLGKEAGMAPK